uniref:Sugar phosphate transporter domain-containing protein n=1 Tax=Leersia perrieri TaxID=77586 RepID=A0A0D9WF20_9ORYZ
MRAEIGVYFATWWVLNVIFNIYNKKVLNTFPYPWLTSTLSLAEPPSTNLDFWKALSPRSRTPSGKSGEPTFSVLVSMFFLGEHFPAPVYFSLLPIIGGCALAAITELNFSMIGFMGAMISNLAFVSQNIFSKKGMKGKSVSGMNYYACLSMLSLVILLPFALAMEGHKGVGCRCIGWCLDKAIHTQHGHRRWWQRRLVKD